MVRLFRIVKSFERKHRDVVIASSSESAITYALAVFYVMLPIIVMSMYNEVVAGIFLGAFNLIQAFIFNPISGALTDKFGAKKMLLAGSAILAADAILFFVLPITPVSIVVFTSIYFVGYSMRIADTYILRVADKNSGGMMFGLYEDLKSIAFFLATLSIPIFSVSKNYKMAGIVLFVFSVISFLMMLKVKNDLAKPKKIPLLKAFDMIYTIKSSFHFIKKNKYFPLLTLSTAVFEGFFYGTIWFLFPVHFVKSGGATTLGSLVLGIYEIVTILLAGYAGYLADKYKWNMMLKLGWLLAIIGFVLMPIFPVTIMLIISGAIIAIGNNIFAFSAEHALEKFDIDHKEDGEFMGLKNMLLDTCYGISPLIAGILYSVFGFSITLFVMAAFLSIVGILTIFLSVKLGKAKCMRE